MCAMLSNRRRQDRRVEQQLLLDCSRTALPPEVLERVQRSVQGELNWEYLIQTASWQSVLPFLCYHLVRLSSAAVPPGVLDALQARLRANSTRNLSLATDLLKILQFLESNEISALAFKGPMLAVSSYGNLALRQFGDLDVLVKEKDFPKAKALFLAHGYQPWQELTPLEEAKHFRSNHAYTLVRSQDGLRLDLHWRITQEHYAFELDVESLWSRLMRTSFFGREVYSMSPEDLLLVVCIHGSKHCWERLGWICDVAEVVRANPALRWDEIMSRSSALHSSRAVLLGLDLAETLLAAPLPERILTAVRRDRGVRRVSSLIQKRLFARSGIIGPLESAVLFFMTRERLMNKLPHLLYSFHRSFTPNERDLALVSLPGFTRILYYPLRVMRLTTEHTRGLLSRLLSRAS
jgi:hypothetical protein